MILLGLLPAVFLVLAALAVGAEAWRRRGEAITRREAALVGALITGVVIALGTEILSLLHAVNLAGVLGLWALATGAAGWLVVRRRAEVAGWLRRRREERERPGRVGRALTVVAVGALLAAGVCATLSPPNTFDALAYHLPRQLFWIQAGTVEHYPTSNSRELALSPLAEFVSLHSMILSGGDRYANLVEWAAAVLAIGAVTLIVRELGGGATAQRFGAALAAINPSFYLAASSAKNDMMFTLWLCALAWLIVRTLATPRVDWGLALRLGAATGLAMGTKGTALMFAVPLCCGVGAVMLYRERWRAIPKGAVIAVLAAGLMAGPSWRNIQSFGSPLGPRAGARGDFALGNTVFSAPALASNIVRNLALQAAFVPGAWNEGLAEAVRRAHGVLGIDVEDPRTTWIDTHFTLESGLYNEATAAAPVQAVALLAASVVLGARGGRAASWRVAFLIVSTGAGLLFFCWLLKWQPWHARLHMPPMTVGAAAVACLRLPRRAAMIGGGAAMVAGLGLLAPTALWNGDRPLLTERSVIATAGTRTLMYRLPGLEDAMEELTAEVRRRRPHRVAVGVFGAARYVLLRAVVAELPADGEIEDLAIVVPEDPTRTRPAPDLVIMYGQDRPRLLDKTSGTVFERAFAAPPFTLYGRAEGSSPRRPGEPVASYPLFSGWTSSAGLGGLSMPNRQSALRWRNGLRPRTTFEFRASGPMSLIVRCRAKGAGPHAIRILVNGSPIASEPLDPGGGFASFEFALPDLRPGLNEVVIEYGDSTGNGSIGAQFAWIQIAPTRLP